MPAHTEINPLNFEVLEVVNDLNGFSVAWGIREDGTKRLQCAGMEKGS
ncbi:hypothetical protein [Neptuniibacter sp. QD37_11]